MAEYVKCSWSGLPDFSWRNIPKRGKIYQIATILRNGHKLYQMTVKYSQCPYNILAFFILRPHKIYPYWEFWFENKPSGNPAHTCQMIDIYAYHKSNFWYTFQCVEMKFLGYFIFIWPFPGPLLDFVFIWYIFYNFWYVAHTRKIWQPWGT
jgi:hypothetical protein